MTRGNQRDLAREKNMKKEQVRQSIKKLNYSKKKLKIDPMDSKFQIILTTPILL